MACAIIVTLACQTTLGSISTGNKQPSTETATVEPVQTFNPLVQNARICNAETVWVRLGAGTKFEAVAVVFRGQPLVLTGAIVTSADGGKWYPVAASTTSALVSGFVNSQFVCEVK